MFPGKLSLWCQYESLVMRGESELSASERELIAAYVSGLNACSYCHEAHTVFARAYGIICRHSFGVFKLRSDDKNFAVA
ncbi:carboxymuconolactone decarboxylase family protein [Ruegeria sp. THAF57]|uniref:carboxymuconolactone decarboxylase family protein n=1 Tax=Ruegeria sp. THAF57 TaxID=2744555 RepID=UPI002104AB59|nr:carboxymuconolactone decarboxylase family protein [Ruegeria sp. THAF57]